MRGGRQFSVGEFRNNEVSYSMHKYSIGREPQVCHFWSAVWGRGGVADLLGKSPCTGCAVCTYATGMFMVLTGL